MNGEQIFFAAIGVIAAYLGYLYTGSIDKKHKVPASFMLIREWILLISIVLGTILIRLGATPKNTPEAVADMKNVDALFVAFLIIFIYTRIIRINRFRKRIREEADKSP